MNAYKLTEKPGYSLGRTSYLITSGGGIVEAQINGEQYKALAQRVCDEMNGVKPAHQEAMVPHARAMDLVGDAYNAGTHGIGYSQQAMELHDAIIPAQPSPGGQDALELLARFLQEPMHDLDMEHEISLSTARDAIAFALAARQPVGELHLPQDGFYKIVYDDAEVPDESFARSGALDAALRRFEQISNKWNAHLFVRFANNTRDCTVPNATPAQAVDLSTLERFECQLYENPWPHSKMDEVDGGDWVRFDDVKALIDSRTVQTAQAVDLDKLRLLGERIEQVGRNAAPTAQGSGNVYFRNVIDWGRELQSLVGEVSNG